MNYPVHPRDLKDSSSLDAETVTLVVIEALISGQFDELDFTDGVDIHELRQRVLNWEEIDTYRNMISEQKSLFTSAARVLSLSEAEKLDPLSPQEGADKIADKASHVARERLTRTRSHSRMRIVSVAAGFVFISLVGIGIVTIKMDHNSQSRLAHQVADSESHIQHDSLSGDETAGAPTPSEYPHSVDKETTNDRTFKALGSLTSIEELRLRIESENFVAPELDIASQNEIPDFVKDIYVSYPCMNNSALLTANVVYWAQVGDADVAFVYPDNIDADKSNYVILLNCIKQ